MKNFVGIDLGTTNSAICSYNGLETRIWKSPEQNDVTPSAIYIDRRGNKYVGKRAYDSAPNSPDNSAMLFKRLMGTSTPINFPAAKLTKTPEECSAEVLKTLFGYLPEEIRKDPNVGTVITVPAAFNQMQKDATMQAASMAGIGNVALMQEPVAAVMSVMRTRNNDGMFLIYDLGGGTLDIAVAESIDGQVNLLANGGIAMCGGRDFDRVLIDKIVRPWLAENFNLPKDFSKNPEFKSLIRMAAWATERAKIELSAREEAVISLSETEARAKDLDDNEIYIDITLDRDTYNNLIADRVNESIDSARETLNKAGLSPHDLDRIVFVGGPTNYKPLRDKVAFELGVKGNTDVNPMTAVAEGASLFAESIDWDSQNRSRKSSRGQISSNDKLALSFNYNARTPNSKAKIVAQLATDLSGAEFQIDCADTGWTSGRLPLKNGATIEVNLAKKGENIFKVLAFDSTGEPICLEKDEIIITRTAASVDAIPASHSIGIEVLEKLGGRPVLDYLVRAGDSLPKKGKKVFKAAESLKAGSPSSINLKIWEGEIEDPITDNRPIGLLKIAGADFDDGVIPAGADLECEYEILDSGNINIEVSVPSIGGTFNSSGKNFYSRQEGQLDYTSAATMISEEAKRTMDRINEISKVVQDRRLEQAKQKIELAVSLSNNEKETENSQEAMEKILEARKILAQIKKDHLKEIRQIDLDEATVFFNENIRKHANQSEEQAFDNLVKTAQRSIDRNDKDFENQLNELKSKNSEILCKQDWFIVDVFKSMVKSPYLFANKNLFDELIKSGEQLVETNDIKQLRKVVAQLYTIKIGVSSEKETIDAANIVRG